MWPKWKPKKNRTIVGRRDRVLRLVLGEGAPRQPTATTLTSTWSVCKSQSFLKICFQLWTNFIFQLARDFTHIGSTRVWHLHWIEVLLGFTSSPTLGNLLVVTQYIPPLGSVRIHPEAQHISRGISQGSVQLFSHHKFIPWEYQEIRPNKAISIDTGQIKTFLRMKREWTIPILSDKIFLLSGKWWNCSGGHATTSWAATLGFEENSNISYFASFSLFFTSYPLNRFFRTINTHGMSAFWGYCPMTHLFRLVPSCCLKTTMFKTFLFFFSFVCFLKVFICFFL